MSNIMITEEGLIRLLKRVKRKIYNINRSTDVYTALLCEISDEYRDDIINEIGDAKEMLHFYFSDIVYERSAQNCYEYLFEFEHDRILEERNKLVDFLIKSLEDRIEKFKIEK